MTEQWDDDRARGRRQSRGTMTEQGDDDTAGRRRQSKGTTTEQGDDDRAVGRRQSKGTTKVAVQVRKREILLLLFQLLDAAVTRRWGWMGEGVDCTRGEDFPALHLVTVMYGERCYCAVNE